MRLRKALGAAIRSLSILSTIGCVCAFLPSFAKANAPQCSGIFAVERDPYSILKEIFQTSTELWNFLESKKGEDLTPADLASRLKALDILTLKYFEEAGIRVEAVPFTFSGSLMFGSKIKDLTYNTYKVLSSSTVTDNGKFINGILTGKKIKDVALFYDPILRFRGTSNAFFRGNDKVIYFSYTAMFRKAFGYGDDLRHEVQHAFEFKKIVAGKNTLSSFKLHDGMSKEPYGDYFSLDEAESTLRDLRFATRQTPKYELLPFSKEDLDQEEMIKADLALAQRFIKNAKAVFAEVKELKPMTTWKNEDGTSTAVMIGLTNPYYRSLGFSVKLKANQTIEEAYAEHVVWAKKRLQEIEAEVLKIKSSRPK